MTERAALPPFAPGQRIGLLGGSFNPPHEAHRLLSLHAIKRLQLDAVWWLVTPGNPLKDTHALPPLDTRMAACERLAHDPRIAVSGIEARIGTRYTLDTLSYLRTRCAGVDFVWLMGADNLAQFHRWQGWRRIARLMPFAVIDRPPASLKALASPAAQTLNAYRLDESDAPALARRPPPAWMFLHGLKSPLSSTLLRRDLESTVSASQIRAS